MAKKMPKLHNDLYYEILNLLIDWILTNNIKYSMYDYDKIGYFPEYDKEDYNRVPANWYTWWRDLSWHLLDPDLEKRINEKENPYPLAYLEDEKLSIIHDKILFWYEQHRLHPKFNKPTPNGNQCNRTTQYKNARNWLNHKLTLKLWEWKKENNVEYQLTIWCK